MALVGALALALAYLAGAWRAGSAAALERATRALLVGALPAYIVMRVGAQWIYDEEGFTGGGDDPAWVAIGFAVSDLGLLALLIALLVAGLGARRAGRAAAAARGARADPPPGANPGRAAPGAGTVRVAAGLVSLLIAAYVVAIWAMTTKPG